MCIWFSSTFHVIPRKFGLLFEQCSQICYFIEIHLNQCTVHTRTCTVQYCLGIKPTITNEKYSIVSKANEHCVLYVHCVLRDQACSWINLLFFSFLRKLYKCTLCFPCGSCFFYIN